MATAGEASGRGSLTDCNARTSRTSANWPRRVRRGNVVYLPTATRERTGRQPNGHGGASRGDALHLLSAARERAGRQRNGHGRRDAVIPFTYKLQREDELGVSEMAPAGKARRYGSLTTYNVGTSRTSAKWPRRGETR